MYDVNSLKHPELALGIVHDGRHSLSSHPMARESIPYCIAIPEEGIALFTYTWVDSDSNAGAALAVFGPGVGETPIQQRIADRPVPIDMNFDDWHIDEFSMSQDLQFQVANISWKNEQVELDFQFNAYHPPYAYSMHKDGCPAYVASNRIEQSGVAVGTLKIGSRIIPINTTAHRDHSWGARDWKAMQHTKWFQGQVGDGVSVHFWQLQALGRTDIRGYVYKGGLQAEIVSIDIDVQVDEKLMQKSISGSVTDDEGRVTKIEGQFYARYPLVPDPEFVLNEGFSAVVIDGEAGVGQLEMGWPRQYIEYIGESGIY